ncbi:alpha-D-ribose 1-methylphosphonate 5-phosphate C-P-lyase PhnJ [Arthrobacter sulfonylureivorans]|uniref:Alpha-D-ribose 1-methylphosphonate 5-phosphate C-P-lyase PhnJ n=1 Tax=Arthrobacter sulfonylureivorans TaxID=2486855 RepID=A0ABY3WF56_9MICC|nr:alpha-D-ribose 1-methylphosphonate 5-phosphate C-P-lyase PhnJ [Arthrobacter sulfonylureivorans]UNK47823.1 alpha-D-ribose 1-methylphosphonate 5-phosphate C-P-lyase PhnJ [Arthrobacter sulfonylureivorans]
MTTATVAELAAQHGRNEAYAYLDERTKRNVRRALLKALAIPGWQVPFASREMPVARGWGSGGLQVTLSLVGPQDAVKVMDQGDDASANASSMRSLIRRTAGCRETTATSEATIIQSRHRIPEIPLRADQLLVLQVPHPEPLRRVVPNDVTALGHHADRDYTPAWLDLYDDEARFGGPRTGADYPVMVEGQTLMSPSPIPRHDVLRLSRRPHPILLGAGRRARVTALPPYTTVEPLAFADRPLAAERAEEPCGRCGSTTSYRVQSGSRYELGAAVGEGPWHCSDTDACRTRRENP